MLRTWASLRRTVRPGGFFPLWLESFLIWIKHGDQ